jgi:hypothetical protein
MLKILLQHVSAYISRANSRLTRYQRNVMNNTLFILQCNLKCKIIKVHIISFFGTFTA